MRSATSWAMQSWTWAAVLTSFVAAKGRRFLIHSTVSSRRGGRTTAPCVAAKPSAYCRHKPKAIMDSVRGLYCIFIRMTSIRRRLQFSPPPLSSAIRNSSGSTPSHSINGAVCHTTKVGLVDRQNVFEILRHFGRRLARAWPHWFTLTATPGSRWPVRAGGGPDRRCWCRRGPRGSRSRCRRPRCQFAGTL